MSINFSKALHNLFKPTILNFILALCIIIILILIYLKNKKIDLFGQNDTLDPTNTNLLLAGDDYLSSFITKYINNIQQKNKYMKTLATQQQTIQNLTEQVTNIINPST